MIRVQVREREDIDVVDADADPGEGGREPGAAVQADALAGHADLFGELLHRSLRLRAETGVDDDIGLSRDEERTDGQPGAALIVPVADEDRTGEEALPHGEG